MTATINQPSVLFGGVLQRIGIEGGGRGKLCSETLISGCPYQALLRTHSGPWETRPSVTRTPWVHLLLDLGHVSGPRCLSFLIYNLGIIVDLIQEVAVLSELLNAIPLEPDPTSGKFAVVITRTSPCRECPCTVIVVVESCQTHATPWAAAH